MLDWTDIHAEADLSGRNFGLFLLGSLRDVPNPVLSLSRPSSVDLLLQSDVVFTLQVGEQVWDVSNGKFRVQFDASPVTFVPAGDDLLQGTGFFSHTFRGSLAGVSRDGEVQFGLIGRGDSWFQMAGPDGDSVALLWGDLNFENAAPIPEPATVILLGVAAGAAVARRAQRKR